MGVETAPRPAHTARQRVSSSDNQSAHNRVPTEAELTSLFDAAMQRSAAADASFDPHNAPAMTLDEQQKFLKAMQDHEFRTLLNDYMHEISDPSNRAETEQYLAQLEREQKVPHDKLLIKPTPGFVIKTTWLGSRRTPPPPPPPTSSSSSSSSSSTTTTTTPVKQKLFVNICSSDKLQPPSSTKIETKGTSWSLPYSLGPERLEKDKRGDRVTTFDVCFHPRTLQFATLQKPYRDMVVATCLEAIEPLLQKAYKVTTAAAALSRDYHVLKGVLYKSGEPVTMCLTKPTDTVAETVAPSTATMQRSSGAEDRRGEETELLMQPVASRKQPNEQPRGDTVALPTLVFRVVHRGRFEMMDHMQATLQADRRVPVNRPKELVVEIECPTFASAKGIDLDVNDRAVHVVAKGYAPLQVALPFAVVEAKGSAKFDKKTRTLVVTLPVQPPEVKRMVIDEHSEEEELAKEEETEQKQETEAEAEASVERLRNLEMQDVVTERKAAAAPPARQTSRTEQQALFASLRETAMMVANDPMYNSHQEAMEDLPKLAETNAAVVSTAPHTATLAETVQQLVANDTSDDDLPPLESCREDESNAHETSSSILAAASPKAQAAGRGEPVAPPFTVKTTARCCSYLVEVAAVDASSVQLTFPSCHGFVLAFATATTAYALCVDDLVEAMDTSRSECHVATENVVVVLYKKTPVASAPVVAFQNDLLFEVD